MEELKTPPTEQTSQEASLPRPRQRAKQSGYQRVAELHEVGMSTSDIVAVLQKEGLTEKDIFPIIQGWTQLDSYSSHERARRGGKAKDMKKGIYWCAGGMMLTGINFFLSGPIGLYLPAWCAVMYGVLRLLKGLRKIIR